MLLAKSVNRLSDAESVFLLSFVVYRFRNNIFHGNKGVNSWLSYTEQIELCIRSMMAFVNHAESRLPTMALAEAG